MPKSRKTSVFSTVSKDDKEDAENDPNMMNINNLTQSQYAVKSNCSNTLKTAVGKEDKDKVIERNFLRDQEERAPESEGRRTMTQEKLAWKPLNMGTKRYGLMMLGSSSPVNGDMYAPEIDRTIPFIRELREQRDAQNGEIKADGIKVVLSGTLKHRKALIESQKKCDNENNVASNAVSNITPTKVNEVRRSKNLDESASLIRTQSEASEISSISLGDARSNDLIAANLATPVLARARGLMSQESGSTVAQRGILFRTPNTLGRDAVANDAPQTIRVFTPDTPVETPFRFANPQDQYLTPSEPSYNSEGSPQNEPIGIVRQNAFITPELPGNAAARFEAHQPAVPIARRLSMSTTSPILNQLQLIGRHQSQSPTNGMFVQSLEITSSDTSMPATGFIFPAATPNRHFRIDSFEHESTQLSGEDESMSGEFSDLTEDEPEDEDSLDRPPFIQSPRPRRQPLRNNRELPSRSQHPITPNMRTRIMTPPLVSRADPIGRHMNTSSRLSDTPAQISDIDSDEE